MGTFLKFFKLFKMFTQHSCNFKGKKVEKYFFWFMALKSLEAFLTIFYLCPVVNIESLNLTRKEKIFLCFDVERIDGTERYDFWSRFLLLHSPFLFHLFFRREEKKIISSKNRDQKSYLSVPSKNLFSKKKIFKIFFLHYLKVIKFQISSSHTTKMRVIKH